MKWIIIILPILIGFTSFSQNTAIPDPNFEQALINLGLDSGPIDGSVLTSNISAVTSLDVSFKNISNLTGIQGFTSLSYLDCENNLLSNLNCSQNLSLSDLYCSTNQLTSLNINQNNALTYLNCSNNQLSSLDVTQNTNLTDLYCSGNPQTSLNITQNTNLTTLHCGSNNLTSLNITQNTALKYLYCHTNQLANLDVTQNTALISIQCQSNPLMNLDLIQNSVLTGITCYANQLQNLDVTQNTNLTYLNCSNNLLSNIDVSQNVLLNNLSCNQNQLITLDISQNALITELYCQENQLICVNAKNGNNINFTYFYAQTNPSLTCIEVDDSSWATINWASFSFKFDSQTSFSTNCNNICSSVGINEYNLSTISVFPNPTTGDITIDLRGIITNLTVTLTNTIGQVVLSKNYTSTNLIKFDIDTPKGIYFLRLESEGEVVTKKITLQ